MTVGPADVPLVAGDHEPGEGLLPFAVCRAHLVVHSPATASAACFVIETLHGGPG
jgi:hypothetical protein